MAIEQHLGCTVVTGEADIRKVQRLAIQCALQLEVTTGLKHSQNSAVLGARKLLGDAGKKVPRTKEALLRAFYEWRKELGDDPIDVRDVKGAS